MTEPRTVWVKFDSTGKACGVSEKGHNTIPATWDEREFREVPADDDEPITAEWLESVGFEVHCHTCRGCMLVAPKTCPRSTDQRTNKCLLDGDAHSVDWASRMVSDDADGKFEVRLIDSEHGFFDVNLHTYADTGDDLRHEGGVGLAFVQPKTRGDVRRLCAALGIDRPGHNSQLHTHQGDQLDPGG